MKVKLEPRASGEAARVMFKEYDVPLDTDVGLPAELRAERRQRLVAWHPVGADPGVGCARRLARFAGRLWFTCNIPNKQITIGRISTKTGAVKLFAVPGPQASWRRPTA